MNRSFLPSLLQVLRVGRERKRERERERERVTTLSKDACARERERERERQTARVFNVNSSKVWTIPFYLNLIRSRKPLPVFV